MLRNDSNNVSISSSLIASNELKRFSRHYRRIALRGKLPARFESSLHIM